MSELHKKEALLSENFQTASKSLLLYVHYDRDGKVDPHIYYQLKSLHDFGLSIIFISNSPITNNDQKKLHLVVQEIILRPDEGYDWTAWKEYIGINIEKISKLKKLFLMNSSCYGPIFPLSEIFECMEKRICDVWSVTKHSSNLFPEHIQPYFACINNKFISSGALFKFFQKLEKIENYNDAIFKGEIAFSSFLKKEGFTYEVYADLKDYEYLPEIGIGEPLIFSEAATYIKKYRIPFLKVKAFRTDFNQRISHAPEIFQALNKSQSAYPRKFILDHLKRTTPLSWHKNLPGTLNVFHRNSEIIDQSDLKIGVILHLFYPEAIEEIFEWLKNIPYHFDLLVSCSQEVKELLENTDKVYLSKLHNIMIKVVPNRGRDILPWLIAFKDIHFDYDIILKLQMKKSKWLSEKIGVQWNDFILDSTLASPSYISRIINLFTEDAKLGLVFHTTSPIFNMYSPHGYQGNSEDRRFFKEWLKNLNLNIPEETATFVHPVSTFWYRPEAFRILLNYPIKPTEFPPEPFPDTGTIAHGLERAMAYIAQGHGYHYKLVIPDDYLLQGFQMYEDSILSNYSSQQELPHSTAQNKFSSYDPCKKWNSLKRIFIPALVHLPSRLFPSTRARALYTSGRRGKAIKVLKRVKNPPQHIVSLLEKMERDIYQQNIKISLPTPLEESPHPAETAHTSIRAIAYYLPQFHTFAENDQWWGKGFTEWANVTKATPLFKGHLQPKVPAHFGYYDLQDIDVMKQQAELAKKFGIYGFCFYHYYFNGKRLMEKPVDNLLRHPEINIPFCLCWANENWTRRWDGRENDILISQTYSADDDVLFIKSLLPYFRDKRYIKIHEKPVLLIYNVKHIPDIKATVSRWRRTLNAEGEDVYLVMVHFYGPHDPRKYGFDAAAEFRPHELNYKSFPLEGLNDLNPEFGGTLWDYNKIIEFNPLSHKNYTLFRGVCVNFDNTARRGPKAALFANSSPKEYEKWLHQVCRFTHENMPSEERYIFINAWNEWAEGAILEPDKDWGYSYLNATSRVLSHYHN